MDNDKVADGDAEVYYCHELMATVISGLPVTLCSFPKGSS